MRVEMRLFGMLRELAGSDSVTIELRQDATSDDAIAAVVAMPGLAGAIDPSGAGSQFVVAVNHSYIRGPVPLSDGDEIAIIPPVSGGEDTAARQVIDPAGSVRLIGVGDAVPPISELMDAVTDPRCGALVTFSGLTRNVDALEYESYVEMTVDRLERLAREEIMRHGAIAAAIVHRVGTVPLSSPSVVIAVSAAHRGPAFETARVIIDRAKSEAPIWKVEVSDGHRYRVEGALPPTPEGHNDHGVTKGSLPGKITTSLEIAPHDVLQRLVDGAILIDVRSPREFADVHVAGTPRIEPGSIVAELSAAATPANAAVFVICATGARSARAVKALRDAGYPHAQSVAGGIVAWEDAELAVERPLVDQRLAPGSDGAERYARHISLPEVGVAGQLRLLDARVLVVGAGGLGAPVLQYLAAAGVGCLGIVDDDVVDRSNLQRQVIHRDDMVRAAKTRSAADAIRRLNPTVDVRAYQMRFDDSTAAQILDRGWHVIVDCVDSLSSRYDVNRAAVRAGLQVIHGSVAGFEGRVVVLGGAGPCYRCIFPAPLPSSLSPTCSEIGVLGAVPGIVGTMQAAETLKILLGIGDPLAGRMLVVDVLRGHTDTFTFARDPSCPECANT